MEVGIWEMGNRFNNSPPGQEGWIQTDAAKPQSVWRRGGGKTRKNKIYHPASSDSLRSSVSAPLLARRGVVEFFYLGVFTLNNYF
jgi:hypothetical protein